MSRELYGAKVKGTSDALCRILDASSIDEAIIGRQPVRVTVIRRIVDV